MSPGPLDNALPDELLPSLPAAACKALELVGRPTVDPRELGTLIKRDERLMTRILRAVNSGRLNLPDRCASLEGAVAHLGQNTVRLLVIGFSLVDLTSGIADELNLTEFWRRCFYSAAAGRRIAVVTGSCDPEVAFIAGLLQDIGMLAMISALGDRYRRVLTEADGSHLLLPGLEHTAVGFTHAEAGAHLGSRWGLNAELLAPIRLHHQPVTGLQGCLPAITAVALAARMAVPEDVEAVLAMSRTLFRLTGEQTRSLMQQTARDTRGLSGLLDVNETPPRPVDLTAQFRAVLAQRYQRAITRGGCLGLIIGEPDAMRDRAARAIFERVRPRAAAGGAEPMRLPEGRFAIIVPAATRHETSMLAERLRQDVAGAPFDVRDGGGRVERLPLSISAGAAALEPAVMRRLSSPQRLEVFAENALRFAVRAGRNCVRVFTPRRQAGDDRSHAA